jgi:DNA mismatch repair ATPase MutS
MSKISKKTSKYQSIIISRLISSQDAVDIYEFVQTLNSLIEFIRVNEKESGTKIWERYLSNFEIFEIEFRKVMEIIEKIVDLKRVEDNEYVIHPKYDPELLELHQSMNDSFQKLESIRKKAEDELGLVVELKSDELHGKHLRVPQSV